MAGAGLTLPMGEISADSPPTDPTLARWLLDTTVRELYAASGKSTRDLAQAAGVGLTTAKRWVNSGNQEWKPPQIRALLAAMGYGHDHTITQQLVSLAGAARRHNVVQPLGWLSSTAFDLFVALEQVSEVIRTYEVTIVPGICQTPAYAAAHFEDLQMSEADERVRLRTRRQEILHREEHPAQLHVIIDEAVLHRSPVDREVMRGQLQHLLTLGALPNVTLQVIPFTAGPYATDGNGPFVIMDSAQVGRQIAYVETAISATYLETPEAIERYLAVWERLSHRALGAEETAALITAVLRRV